MSTFFQIPGNIKQQYQPFVLNKLARINGSTTKSNDLIAAQPQLFTFRDPHTTTQSGTGILNICPSSFKNYIDKDISHMLLFDKAGSKKSVSYQSIFNSLPGIQIREFLPDTKLDQCINFFGDCMDKMKDLWSQQSDLVGRDRAYGTDAKGHKVRLSPTERKAIVNSVEKGFFTKFKMVMSHAFDYLTGGVNPNIYTDMGIKSPRSSYRFVGSKGPDLLVLDFPYLLYYRLISCVTTNIYELPCVQTSKQLYSSDGSQGWPGAGFELLGKDSFLSKIPLIGGMLENVTSNIRISYMPQWVSADGNKTPHPSVEVKFSLFNDTKEAAMQNFVFANTLVGGNKWIQYGMFQHSPNLYDIKIEGYDRLFACTGKFSVNYNGVLRDPSDAFIDELVGRYGNCGDGTEEKTKNDSSMLYRPMYDSNGDPVKVNNDGLQIHIKNDPTTNSTLTTYGPEKFKPGVKFQIRNNVVFEGYECKSYATDKNFKQNGIIDLEQFKLNIKKNKLIKIPDIYEVTMTFNSLLPDNFNNFIFKYSENNNQIDNYQTHVYDRGIMSEILGGAVAGFTSDTIGYINTITSKENEEINKMLADSLTKKGAVKDATGTDLQTSIN